MTLCSDLSNDVLTLLRDWRSGEISLAWKSLKAKTSAANTYDDEFNKFKKTFDPWMKWHIKLVGKFTEQS